MIYLLITSMYWNWNCYVIRRGTEVTWRQTSRRRITKWISWNGQLEECYCRQHRSWPTKVIANKVVIKFNWLFIVDIMCIILLICIDMYDDVLCLCCIDMYCITYLYWYVWWLVVLYCINTIFLLPISNHV